MKKNILSVFAVMFLLVSTSFAGNEKFYAVYLYNFTKYLEWPDNANETVFVISVIGNDEIVRNLKEIAASKAVGAKKIIVNSCGGVSQAKGSQIVFLASSQSSSLETAKQLSAADHALLVCESEGLARGGACINFKTVNSKLSFEINKSVISKNGLKLNSKLEELGIVVG